MWIKWGWREAESLGSLGRLVGVFVSQKCRASLIRGLLKKSFPFSFSFLPAIFSRLKAGVTSHDWVADVFSVPMSSEAWGPTRVGLTMSLEAGNTLSFY